MKYLKQYEELNPDTYISAGNKMLSKYQTGRGENLINYGNDIKKKKYNLFSEIDVHYLYNDDFSSILDNMPTISKKN